MAASFIKALSPFEKKHSYLSKLSLACAYDNSLKQPVFVAVATTSPVRSLTSSAKLPAPVLRQAQIIQLKALAAAEERIPWRCEGCWHDRNVAE